MFTAKAESELAFPSARERTELTVSSLHIQRVLQGDDILASEGLVRHEVEPMRRLDVESVDRFASKDVARGLDGDDVRMLVEELEGDGVVIELQERYDGQSC